MIICSVAAKHLRINSCQQSYFQGRPKQIKHLESFHADMRKETCVQVKQEVFQGAAPGLAGGKAAKTKVSFCPLQSILNIKNIWYFLFAFASLLFCFPLFLQKKITTTFTIQVRSDNSSPSFSGHSMTKSQRFDHTGNKQSPKK